MTTIKNEAGQSIAIAGGNDIRVGDTFTIAGVEKRNPAWRWWAFWRPKMLKGDLQQFVVHSVR